MRRHALLLLGAVARTVRQDLGRWSSQRGHREPRRDGETEGDCQGMRNLLGLAAVCRKVSWKSWNLKATRISVNWSGATIAVVAGPASGLSNISMVNG